MLCLVHVVIYTVVTDYYCSVINAFYSQRETLLVCLSRAIWKFIRPAVLPLKCPWDLKIKI